MEILIERTITRHLRRTPLTQSQFEQICFRAAKNSTNCAQYIQRVLTHMCRWLRIPNPVQSSSTEKVGGENTHLAVIALYHLLDKTCRYDFDVASVLTACREGANENRL